jgi:hypothetical protein
MSTPSFDANNPYQSPARAAGPLGTQISATSAAVVKMVKDFRTQIHALGAFWIFIGIVAAGLGLFVTASIAPDSGQPRPGVQAIMAVVLVGFGLAWITLGVLTCVKQIWAVYVGLVLSYLSLISNLLNFNVCGLIIVIAVILQGHRVIGWAGQLTRAGIPLSARPEQIALPSQKTVDPSQWQTGSGA